MTNFLRCLMLAFLCTVGVTTMTGCDANDGPLEEVDEAIDEVNESVD